MTVAPRPFAAFVAVVTIGVLLRVAVAERALVAHAAAAAATVALAWYAGGTGRFTPFVTGLFVAASPWAVAASRTATTDVVLVMSFLVASAIVAQTRDLARGARVVTSIAALGLYAFGALRLTAERVPFVHAPFAERLGILLAGDVGVGVAFFALAALLCGRRRLEKLALLGASLLLFVCKPSGASLALVVAPLLWVASDEVARWCESLDSPRARAAVLVVALGPTLPTLWSDVTTDRRADVAALRLELAKSRRADEPLFCNERELATELLSVSARPLDEALAPGALPPRGHDAFVLLLLDRGRLLDGRELPPDFESRLELVARAGRRRLDLHRYEARLYRSRHS
jgi:hypothetical protein